MGLEMVQGRVRRHGLPGIQVVGWLPLPMTMRIGGQDVTLEPGGCADGLIDIFVVMPGEDRVLFGHLPAGALTEGSRG